VADAVGGEAGSSSRLRDETTEVDTLLSKWEKTETKHEKNGCRGSKDGQDGLVQPHRVAAASCTAPSGTSRTCHAAQ
jgi:hypothetical protein